METEARDVRRPYVAGQFYPRNPKELALMIDDLAAEESNGEIIDAAAVWGVILPHAGYVYSGATAVKTLLPLRGRSFRRVVVIAPSHRYPFEGLAAARFEAYETPLGQLPVDTAAVETLLAAGSPLLKERRETHLQEHALEVELPLLQQILAPGWRLVPLICGALTAAQAVRLAPMLRPLHGPDTLWVISSDFTHYGRAFQYVPFRDQVPERLKALDLGAADAILARDLPAFENYLNQTGATICGACPIKQLLALAAEAEPATRVELCHYTTSGELTGDYSHCVSYAGFRLFRS